MLKSDALLAAFLIAVAKNKVAGPSDPRDHSMMPSSYPEIFQVVRPSLRHSSNAHAADDTVSWRCVRSVLWRQML